MSTLARPRAARGEVAVVLAGTVGAVLLRVGVTQLLGPGSVVVGVVFAAVLIGLSACCGFVFGWPSLRRLAIGAAGAAVLVGFPLLSRAVHGAPLPPRTAPLGLTFLVWAGVVALVGTAEEVLFRGVLHDAALAVWSAGPAVCLGALAFGLLHVPFYGWGALPVDVAAGLWLGALRVASGGVAAPAAAHVLADWSTWWLR